MHSTPFGEFDTLSPLKPGLGMSTTDTGIAFKKVSKNAPKLSFKEWNKYLNEIAGNKKVDVNTIKTKLVDCGDPGFTGETVYNSYSFYMHLFIYF